MEARKVDELNVEIQFDVPESHVVYKEYDEINSSLSENVWELPDSAIIDIPGASNDVVELTNEYIPLDPLHYEIDDPCVKLGVPTGRVLKDTSFNVTNTTFKRLDGPEPMPAVVITGSALDHQLAEARKVAEFASMSQDRTNDALYRAIGGAFDLALAAAAAPAELDLLLRGAGLERQSRAPMTPIAKLVFGTACDKTRLAEYSAALDHGLRLNIGAGQFGQYLTETSGGLKAVVQAERRLRREERGKATAVRTALSESIASKLRAMPGKHLSYLEPEGDEFVLVLARRMPSGVVVVVEEVPRNISLLDQSAKAIIDKHS